MHWVILRFIKLFKLYEVCQCKFFKFVLTTGLWRIEEIPIMAPFNAVKSQKPVFLIRFTVLPYFSQL